MQFLPSAERRHYMPPAAKSLRNCATVKRMLESADRTLRIRREQGPPLTAKRNPERKPKPTAVRRGQRLSVSIIGAGRLGTALAIALHKSGHSIDLIVARHAASAKRASELSGGLGRALSAPQFRRLLPKHRELLEQSSLILIATPDDVIGIIADELAALLRFRTTPARGLVVLHTSGALSSNVLGPLTNLGIAVGALHPLVSISEAQSGADWLTRAFFSVEGDSRAMRLGRRIVRDFGAQAFTISPSAKPLYHAAALMASPNLTALIDISFEMLSRCGLTANQSQKVLLPLLRSTIENLAAADPARALTGTFKRGDVATVQKHVEAISSKSLFDALEAYVLLGRRSMRLAKGKSASRVEINRILAQALTLIK
jgi:predicted short-subunit dehydrogenase-like oxidoreductase (DUF2520 family)